MYSQKLFSGGVVKKKCLLTKIESRPELPRTPPLDPSLINFSGNCHSHSLSAGKLACLFLFVVAVRLFCLLFFFSFSYPQRSCMLSLETLINFEASKTLSALELDFCF